MALLDRLRPQPGWKHPDPAIRLSAVETLPATEQTLLATLAREDDAPRVRRAAVARLDDPDALGTVATRDTDDQVKADAVARLTKIATDGPDAALRLRAVAALAEERHLVVVARSGAAVEVCDAALARVQEAKALGGVARHAEQDAIRLRALTRLNDRGEIEAVATHTEHKDVGLAALERLDETAVLERIAVRAKEKVVARRAKAIVKDRAAADAESRAAADALARRRALLTEALQGLEKTRDRMRAASELERLTSEWRALGTAPDDSDARWHQGTERVRMHIDDLVRQETADAERRTAVADAVARRRALIDAALAADGRAGAEADADQPLAGRLDALRAEWAALPSVEAEELKGLDREFTQAVSGVESRAAARTRAANVQGRLVEIAAEATKLAETDTLDAVRQQWTALASEWRDRTHGVPVDAAVQAEYSGAAGRWQQREQALRDAAARGAAENLTRLEELLERATRLSASAETPTKDIDRTVRDLRTAAEQPGPLPAGHEELLAKLKTTLGSLTPRLREAREADDWRRWANAGIQEELCKRIEGLRELTDVVEVSKQLKELRRQWKAVSSAPKDEADALWQRFKAAGDELQARVDTHLAVVVAEQGANLAKKMALVEKAEALAQSTDWIATAETLKGLQAEWNTVGPVPGQRPGQRGRDEGSTNEQTTEVARRFRAACDTFFTRRKTDLVQRKGEWAQNQQKKEALCARMEELAESTDWAATFNEIKKLQADWKVVGPVRRNKSEALWKRFRGACDRFFERYGRRHEIDLHQRVEEREALCRTLEALAPGALAAAAAAATEAATQAATEAAASAPAAVVTATADAADADTPAVATPAVAAADTTPADVGAAQAASDATAAVSDAADAAAVDAADVGAAAAEGSPAPASFELASAADADVAPESQDAALTESGAVAEASEPTVGAVESLDAPAADAEIAAIAQTEPADEVLQAEAAAPVGVADDETHAVAADESQPVAVVDAASVPSAEVDVASIEATSIEAGAADTVDTVDDAHSDATGDARGDAADDAVAAAAEASTRRPPLPLGGEGRVRGSRPAADDHAPADTAAPAVAVAAAPPVPVEPPSHELILRTVEDVVRRWRQAPGLPSEALVPVRARFESALTTLLTSYAPAFQGTPFDLEQTRRRMKALCDDVENVARGLPAAQLGSTSVAALATLLKESLAANTIGGRVNEEAKLRAAADRVRRAQMQWRDVGPALDSETHQLESRFHRAVRRFFEEHPQLDQQHRDQRDQRDNRDQRDARGGPRGRDPRGRDQRGPDDRPRNNDRDRGGLGGPGGGSPGPRGPRPQGGGPPRPQRTP